MTSEEYTNDRLRVKIAEFEDTIEDQKNFLKQLNNNDEIVNEKSILLKNLYGKIPDLVNQEEIGIKDIAELVKQWIERLAVGNNKDLRLKISTYTTTRQEHELFITYSFFKFISLALRLENFVDDLKTKTPINKTEGLTVFDFIDVYIETRAKYFGDKKRILNAIPDIMSDKFKETLSGIWYQDEKDEKKVKYVKEFLETAERAISYNKHDESPDFQGGASSSTCLHILGRKRKVQKVGRKKMITYKGELISITEARMIEKKIAQGKKKINKRP